jgi:hypothetical protein
MLSDSEYPEMWADTEILVNMNKNTEININETPQRIGE